jgi:competence protein ComEA
MRVKWKKPELAAAGITLLFLCFTLGYFLGRNSNTGVIAISETIPPPETPVSAAAPPPETPPAALTAAPLSPPAAASDTPPAPTPESHRSADGKLQINLATAAELAELPGIGEVLAARIVAYRDAHGDFKRTSSVENVSGIGDGKYAAIKDLITVD